MVDLVLRKVAAAVESQSPQGASILVPYLPSVTNPLVAEC